MSLTSSPSSPRPIHQRQLSSSSPSPSTPLHGLPQSAASSSSSYSSSPRSRSYTLNSTTTSSSTNGDGSPTKNGYFTKSEPTSPNGRVVIQGLTPIGNINGIQLDQYKSQPQLQPQARYGASQNGLMGPPTNIQSSSHPHQIQHHIQPSQSHSPPTSASYQTRNQNQVPWQITQQHQQQQHAGPSRSTTIPIPIPVPVPGHNAGVRPSYNPITSTAPFAKYKGRQIPAKPKHNVYPSTYRNGNGNIAGEDSGIDSDATVRPGRNKGSLSQPDLTALRSRRVEGWTEGLRAGSGRSSQVQQSAISQGQGQRLEQTEGIPSGNGDIKRRPSNTRTKTPPSTNKPYGSAQPSTDSKESWLPASPTHSRSHSSQSLSSLSRKSPSDSPRSTPLYFPVMSPITPSGQTQLYSSSEDEGPPTIFPSNKPPSGFGPFIPLDRDNTSSSGGEADDDYSHSPSSGSGSGSITFSPKRTKFKSSSSGGLRNRFLGDKRYSPTSSTSTSVSSSTGLGLTLNDNDDNTIGTGTETDMDLDTKEDRTNSPDRLSNGKSRSSRAVGVKILDKLENIFQQSTLLPLRLLAIIPSLWGICVLIEALVTGGLWVDVWPWGVDLTREALERLVAGGEGSPGEWRKVDRGDVGLCVAWAICTAHFCFSLTTGLTHRWRSYYSLPSTITRLVSLQCLCWPATYLTLWFLGVDRLLLCWVVIGVTTGWSRTVQMWVTSNVIPPPPRPTDPDEFAGGGAGGGDITPNIRKMNIGPPEIPEGLSAWEAFRWGRKWDWDNVAREVGWKVGGLLLVTCAWLFWGIEKGTRVRI
ncbi:hypothetical protein V865_004770 [Kwoniella europaea PYCC6329]|uniref:N-glycosylation protein EOS1 n=1 Tax=Kwoniella europaea PYCC6329 TaxID=1423913 RepID=A0AAX4KJT7_9TREE